MLVEYRGRLHGPNISTTASRSPARLEDTLRKAPRTALDVVHQHAAIRDMDTCSPFSPARVNYIRGVPGADDIMLNYQSTSFHDASIAPPCSTSAAPEFDAWLAGDQFLRLTSEATTRKTALRMSEDMQSGSLAATSAPSRRPASPSPHRRQPATRAFRFPALPRPGRDAVHATLKPPPRRNSIPNHQAARPPPPLRRADRATYLQRPDLGRQLDDSSKACSSKPGQSASFDLALIVADGLSALAVDRHVPPYSQTFPFSPLSLAPITVVEQAAWPSAMKIASALHAQFPSSSSASAPASAPDSLAPTSPTTAPRPHRRRTQLHLQHPRRSRATQAAAQLPSTSPKPAAANSPHSSR